MNDEENKWKTLAYVLAGYISTDKEHEHLHPEEVLKEFQDACEEFEDDC